MKRDKSREQSREQGDVQAARQASAAGEQPRQGGQEMSQRVEGVLNASGLRGPAIASLEGGSGLFVLTDEQLLFHDGHGTRRVTLRDLARIHSDAEGTLRVETPAGVAMSASLIGFGGDEVQQFFGQVRDVTARVKSLTSPPPVTSAPVARPSAPARPPAAPAPQPAPAAAPADPDEGVSVTAVRRPAEEPQFSGPPPKITVNRRGQRGSLDAEETGGMRENALGLSAAAGTALDRDLPPPGSVEIRAVRKTSSLTAPTAPEFAEPESEQMVIGARAQAPVQAAEVHPLPDPAPQQAEQMVVTAAPAPVAQPARAAAPAQHYTAADLRAQAGKVRGVPGRLKLLAGVLLVGALVTAVLMFLNAQKFLGLWVVLAGIVGAGALLSLAEVAQLQAIQGAVLADSDALQSVQADDGPDEPEAQAAEDEEEQGAQADTDAQGERQG